MLRGNRRFNNSLAWMHSGLAPAQNALMGFGWACVQAGGFGKKVAVPVGYGINGIFPCITAGSMAGVPRTATDIAFSGSAPINKGISISASGSALEFGGTAGMGAIVRMEASGNALTFSGAAGIYGVASMSANGSALNFTGSALLGGLFDLAASGSAFTFGGSAETHSLAFLETTEVSGEMSEATIAAAVWSKVLGGLLTAEDTLLAAGSAGDPWSAIIDGQLAGEIMALLKAKAEQMAFTNGNIHGDIKAVNALTVDGSGTEEAPWGPA